MRRYDRIGAFGAAVVASMLLCDPALAQLTSSPVIEPQRVEESLEAPAQPLSRPELVIVERAPEAAPAAAADTSFVFRELQIEGANAISTDVLMREWPYQPGDTVSVAQIYGFAASITRAYARAGYATSFAIVPEQRIADGAVRIAVVEGFISDIAITGSEGRVARAVRARLADLTQSRPLRSADLERALLLADDLPGATVRATLSPADGVPGGSILNVAIAHDPVEGDAGYNNYLPTDLERHMAAASLRLNGVLAGTETVRLSALRSLAGNYYWNVSGGLANYVGSDGPQVALDGLYSEIRPADAALQDLEYEGRSYSVRGSMSFPLIRSRARNLSLQWAAELSNADIDLLDTAFQRDRLRTVSGSVSYDFASADRSVTLVRLGLEQGLDIFDARGDSRANGSPVFTLAELQAQRDQPLAAAGAGRLSLFTSAQGQVAIDNALLSGAECGLGGRQFGRRFDPGAITGDHCLLGSAELRWTAPMAAIGTPGAVQAYGFVDGGKTWQKGALQPGQARDATGASGGLGLRLSLPPGLSAAIEGSHAIKRPAGLQTESDFLLSVSVSMRL